MPSSPILQACWKTVRRSHAPAPVQAYPVPCLARSMLASMARAPRSDLRPAPAGRRRCLAPTGRRRTGTLARLLPPVAQKLVAASPRSSQHTTSPVEIYRQARLPRAEMMPSTAAPACPDNRRQAWGDRKVSRRRLARSQGWCRRFRDLEIDCGRAPQPRARSPQWNSRSNGEFAGREKGSQSRESFKPCMANQHGGRQPHPFDLAPPNMRGHFLFLLLDRR